MSVPGRSRLVGMYWCSPDWCRVPHPLLGQPLLSIRLDLQESDGGLQSSDALQDLVNLTRPFSWRLLPRFVGRELLYVLLFIFFPGTGF